MSDSSVLFNIIGNDSKKLFTPGPLLTKQSVKEAMLVDYGSRDIEFMKSIDFIRSKLLDIAGVSSSDYTSVIMQGSGTFGNESCIQTMTPRDKSANYLIIENGAYGQRLRKICQLLDIKCSMISFPEERAVDISAVENYLKKTKGFTHVGVIHNETTAGVLNDVEALGQLIKKYLPGIIYQVLFTIYVYNNCFFLLILKLINNYRFNIFRRFDERFRCYTSRFS